MSDRGSGALLEEGLDLPRRYLRSPGRWKNLLRLSPGLLIVGCIAAQPVRTSPPLIRADPSAKKTSTPLQVDDDLFASERARMAAEDQQRALQVTRRTKPGELPRDKPIRKRLRRRSSLIPR